MKHKDSFGELLSLDKSSYGFLLLKDGKFIACNDKVIEMLGYQYKEEFLNLHPARLSPLLQPDGACSITKAHEMIQHCYDKGEHQFFWTHLRKDGEEFVCEITLTKIFMDAEPMVHVRWSEI